MYSPRWVPRDHFCFFHFLDSKSRLHVDSFSTLGVEKPIPLSVRVPPWCYKSHQYHAIDAASGGRRVSDFPSRMATSTSDVVDGFDLLLGAVPASDQEEDASRQAAVAARGPSVDKQHALRLHQLCVECLMPEEELAARRGWKTVNACYLEGALLKDVLKGKRASTLRRCRSVRRPCPIGMCANFGAGSFRRGHRCPRSCTYAN